MKRIAQSVALSMILVFMLAAVASAAPQTVPQGTRVTLVFDQPLSSKTAKVGDTVRLHVKDAVMVAGQPAIAKGARVQGVITKVDKRKSYGINAEIQLALNPVKSVTGVAVPLEPAGKGQQLGGKKTTEAAGATAGGAVVLGPIGLIGGYFVHGKQVNVKPGDTIVTEVPKTVVIRK